MTSEENIINEIAYLDKYADNIFEQIRQFDHGISQLQAKREQLMLAYDQALARRQDQVKDLDWIQSD